MQVKGMTEGMRLAMELESPRRKIGFAAQASFWMTMFLIIGSLYLVRLTNANKINESYCEGSAKIIEACIINN